MLRLRLAYSLAILAATLTALAGCSGDRPREQTPPPAEEPVISLTLSPASGAPGAEVTATIRVKDPRRVPTSGPEGTSWNVSVCWDQCEPMDWSRHYFTSSPTDPTLFVGTIPVPAFRRGALMPKGGHTISVACQTKGCEGIPAADAPFEVGGELPSVAWISLPAAGAARASMLSSGEQDPVRPKRRLTGKAGAANLRNGGEAPQLVITGDGGTAVRTISLSGVELGAQADISGCRAAALDSGHPDSFYVAGGGHNGAHGWQASPPPLHTADSGMSWHRIPAPAGYDQPGAFLGFLVAPDQVTAWFGRPESERIDAPAEIRGSATADGGKTWSTVSLACPEGAPCAWDLPVSLFLQGYRGLRHSADGGRTWEWAAWNGKRLWALGKGFYRLNGGALEVAGACVGGEFEKACAPLLRSADGGKTWQWVGLPDPAGGWPREMEIRLEQDGSLLGRFGQDWYRLERGKAEWETSNH